VFSILPPPPPRRLLLAAFTIASICNLVILPDHSDTVLFKVGSAEQKGTLFLAMSETVMSNKIWLSESEENAVWYIKGDNGLTDSDMFRKLKHSTHTLCLNISTGASLSSRDADHYIIIRLLSDCSVNIQWEQKPAKLEISLNTPLSSIRLPAKWIIHSERCLMEHFTSHISITILLRNEWLTTIMCLTVNFVPSSVCIYVYCIHVSICKCYICAHIYLHTEITNMNIFVFTHGELRLWNL
jgi:hypothetical protein